MCLDSASLQARQARVLYHCSASKRKTKCRSAGMLKARQMEHLTLCRDCGCCFRKSHGKCRDNNCASGKLEKEWEEASICRVSEVAGARRHPSKSWSAVQLKKTEEMNKLWHGQTWWGWLKEREGQLAKSIVSKMSLICSNMSWLGSLPGNCSVSGRSGGTEALRGCAGGVESQHEYRCTL